MHAMIVILIPVYYEIYSVSSTTIILRSADNDFKSIYLV